MQRLENAITEFAGVEMGVSNWGFLTHPTQDMAIYMGAFRGLCEAGFITEVQTSKEWSNRLVQLTPTTEEHVDQWFADLVKKRPRQMSNPLNKLDKF